MEPEELLTRTQYRSGATGDGFNVRVALVDPVSGFVTSLVCPRYHWYANVPDPVAVTENVAACPTASDWLSGPWVTVGTCAASESVPATPRATILAIENIELEQGGSYRFA